MSALNFGTVTIGANPTIPFQITNSGNADLTVSNMSLVAAGSQKFQLNPSSIEQPIQPLQDVEVQVTYLADDRGDDEGTLQIDHDDPTRGTVFIPLFGRTPAPDIDVMPDFITIQLAQENHSQSTDIRIYNVGDEDILVTGHDFAARADNDGFFVIESAPTYPVAIAPGSIPAGPYETLVIRYDHPDSNATVDDSCTITISSDDPDEAEVVVTVIGTYSP